MKPARTPHWGERYARIPFADGGRDFSGCDCWGLVRLVYETELGLALPSYGDIPASALGRIARRMSSPRALADWRQTADPAAFDVAVMSGRPAKGLHPRAPVHVGLVVDGSRLMHIEEGAGVSVIPLDHPFVRHRIIAIMRHSSR